MLTHTVTSAIPITTPGKRFVLRQWLISDNAFLLYLALIKLSIHLATSGNYGFFRDELYYIDAGKHLAAGYVEFPPFIALLAACIHSIFGDVLVAYHALPALAGAMVVVLSGLMARELGGKRFAQYVLIVLIKRNQPRYWLLFGLIAGIGLTNKITILMFGFAIVVGILLTPNRKYLWNRWTLLSGALVLVFLLPYVIWNAQHGWATLEFWSTYSNGHANPASAGDFLYQQVLTMNPLTLPLWLAGLYYYFTPEGKPYRVFAWAFLILYVLFTITHAKLYFLSPAYPALFAGGAVVVEKVLRNRRWLRATYIALLLLAGLILAPLAMPILPPSIYASTMGFLNGDAGIKVEDRTTGQLPQQLADRFGWDSMTANIAHVYHSLPANEQDQACIFAANYGEAGAIDLYGPQYHLPTAISGHNSYYLWGPGNCSGKIIISIGIPSKQLQTVFTSVTQASINTCQYCMPAENNLPIYIARDPKESIHDIWLGAKHYD